MLPVLGSDAGPDGAGSVAHVPAPGGRTGRTGWIRRRDTHAAHTLWHIVVDVSRRRVTAYRQGRPSGCSKRSWASLQHPHHSDFFVEEAVQLRPGDIGGPLALALSARSDVLHEFEGGPGQIALHGRANIGGVLGSAASHGCVRLDTPAIRWLTDRIGPGVPRLVDHRLSRPPHGAALRELGGVLGEERLLSSITRSTSPSVWAYVR